MDGFYICASEFAFLFLWIGFGGLNETVVVAGPIVWSHILHIDVVVIGFGSQFRRGLVYIFLVPSI
jgi:hypothetical protein